MWRWLGLTAACVIGLAAACSADGASSETDGEGSSTTSSGSTSSGTGGTGAFTGTATGGLDPGVGGSTGSGGDCAATSSEASKLPAPADIIVAVDTSGSMDLEAGWTQDNLPKMAQAITQSGVDAHVVLIASNDMSVPPPLGSGQGGCADQNLPNYRHVCDGVGSNNALQKILQTYPQWKDSLRPTAVKTIVVVSDDDSDMGAGDFTNQLLALDPTFQGFKFDAIVSFAAPYVPGNNCFLISAAEGKVYKQLVSQTGGVIGDLCLQNFDPVFQDISKQVIQTAQISCEYEIPPPPEGETFDLDKVNVQYVPTMGAQPQPIYYIEGGYAACGPTGGWYYDDVQNPKKILLCPASCDTVQQSVDGKVDVLFGCDTLVGPPN